jgi:uncharacterized protein YcbX
MQTGRTAVAVVKAIFRYPVKSMRGEALEQAQVWWHGLEGDRKYGFVQSDSRSDFPWLTGRELADMIRYVPYFVDPANPRESALRVRTPRGNDLPLESMELQDEIAQDYRGPFHVMRLARGCVDSMPVSIISTATLQAIGAWVGAELDVRRFRPNVLVEMVRGEPFEEEGWLGHELSFGEREDSVRLRANRKNKRCVMVNLDPERATQNPKVLREIAQTRDALAGIYGSIEEPGTIVVGDTVWLTRR